MAYWIKNRVSKDYCYDYEDDRKLDYTLTLYDGPFRTINEVEDYLRDTRMDDVEVLWMT